MRINHNIAALNTHRQLTAANGAQSKSMEKLSSGLRINRAGDDAAGLAISEKMRGQIRGLDQASRNSQDGISLIQTAEGALNETHDMLQRMRELAVQSNNGTNTAGDLTEIQKEITELSNEITRVGNKTEFNTKTLLNGSLGVQGANGTTTIAQYSAAGISFDFGGADTGETFTFARTGTTLTLTGTNSGKAQTLSLSDTTAMKAGTTLNFDSLGVKMSFAADVNLATGVNAGDIAADTVTTTGTNLQFQIGANANTTLGISIADMRSTALGSSASNANVANIAAVNVTNKTFNDNIAVIDEAIKTVSAQRSSLGAYQNRLEHTINNLGTSSENLTAAESRIRDVDYALAA
ncbi:flagellin [Bacillus mangrovi]|uniref:Flagellin n=1 Tax=Metabacillus mangrovi TaxID=1491830 RepID=A0A7X2V5R2_9BACI|nr:flagellin [Metabacillus mangrovi]MTH55062.1 flagellin [Metabacillus mangrovi]